MKPVKYSKLKNVLRVRPPKNGTKIFENWSLETKQKLEIQYFWSKIFSNKPIEKAGEKYNLTVLGIPFWEDLSEIDVSRINIKSHSLPL